MIRLAHALRKVLEAALVLLPVPLAVALYASDERDRVHVAHAGHVVAIVAACALAALIGAVAYSGARRQQDRFLEWVAGAYLGFALVYLPHGLLTPLAHQQMDLFLVFGPASRLVLNGALLLGFLDLRRAGPRPAPFRTVLTGSVLIAVTVGLGALLFDVDAWVLRVLEVLAFVSAVCAVFWMAKAGPGPWVMRYHLVAQGLFAQASVAFVLSLPWSGMWWFAHAVSAAGFLVLGYAVTRAWDYTGSPGTVYDPALVHHLVDRVIEDAPVGIAVFDEDLAPLRCNAALARAIGCPTAAGAARLVAGVDPARIEAPRLFHLDEPGGRRTFDVRTARTRPGLSRGYVCTVVEITEAVGARERVERLNRELAERVADLAATTNELSAFGATLSHHLRQPLRAVDAFTELLRQDCAGTLSEGCLDSLDRVQAAGRRMGALVEDLLRLARVSRAEMHTEPVDLSELAEEAVDGLARRCPDDVVTVDIEPGMVAVCDRDLVRVALEHLLDNAWRFTRGRPSRHVAVGREPGEAGVYFVRDDGIGFEAVEAAHLFTDFQHPHAGGEAGSGLGLATVARVVRRHGGRVWAEGAPERGATVRFTLAPDPAGAVA